MQTLSTLVMVRLLDQVNTAAMNPYFKPRMPEPRMSAFDIAIGSLMCAIVVLVVGVGLWLAHDSVHREALPSEHAGLEWGGSSNDNAVVHVAEAPR